MSLYDELGVERTADAATIKRAYRRKVQKEHPDKGGQTDKFQALQLAYDILSDDAKRSRYDETGQTGVPDTEQRIAMVIIDMLYRLVDAADVETVHLVESMRDIIKQTIAETNKKMAGARAILRKRQQARARIRHAGKGRNILSAALDDGIEKAQQQIEALKGEVEFGGLVLKALEEYDYRADVAVVQYATFDAGVFSNMLHP